MGHTQTFLADIISKELGLPFRLGRKFVDRLFDIVSDDIVYSGGIKFRSLGSFYVTKRPPIQTTHPSTGKPILIPEKKILRFRTSSAIKKRLNPEDKSPSKKLLRKARKKRS